MRFLVLQGPNLNLLGEREPALYGHQTLAELQRDLDLHAEKYAVELVHVQSNHEGVLIDAIHAARGTCAGLIVNAGGYSHTSVALRDALSTFSGPIVEVHLSNLARREPFRQQSLVTAVATGSVTGLGSLGYRLALDAVVSLTSPQSSRDTNLARSN
ncbi:MAG: type II 3-dehydroquinate dehydratase [Myxococcales bacterium]|nr:type II 3-dehydroquinate dehydratase [Myxococcales bacterium]